MRNHPDGFDIYLVNVKTIRKIGHIFLVFSEKLNFTILSILGGMFCRILFVKLNIKEAFCVLCRELCV